jgi:hypothetical protein
MSCVKLLVVLLPTPIMGRLYATQPARVAVEKDFQSDWSALSNMLGDSSSTKGAKPITEADNPKCDQACANGSEQRRAQCMLQCAKMQAVICADGFKCKNGCNNHLKHLQKDMPCENLCDDVQGEICAPLGFEAPAGAVSPHHDDKVPPSMEATPAPRIYSGSLVFCNLYPATYEFEVMALDTVKDKEGPVLTKLTYKQCDIIELKTGQFVGLKAKNTFAAVSKPIMKIPSVMLFGQSAFGNHQVEFNRYYARSDGPMLCNGFPIWHTKQIGEPVEFHRDGKKITTLKYKDCYPTSLKEGEVLTAWVKGKMMGQYSVTGNPSAVVLGKAGQTTAVAFEAWTDKAS